MQTNQICQFFDQNVIEKRIKIDPSLQFHKNIESTFLKPNIKQALTPFSLLEFAGVQVKKEIFNIISYKGEKLSKYPCKYEELKGLTSDLKKQIREKVTKDFLKQKLIGKKNRESLYLNNVGEKLINGYIKYYINDNFYNNLIHNLYLDRLPEINTSNFSKKERDEFNKIHLYPFIMRSICDRNRTCGAFRAIKRMDEGICQEINKQEKENLVLNENRKKMKERLDNLNLKSTGDLVDCELIHLACFGYDGHYCRCYTTDKEDIIRERLVFYCTSILFIERWFYEYLPTKTTDWDNYCKEYLPAKKPEWKCGRIFILNPDTGEKVKTIPIRKIYENTKKDIDSILT